MVTDEDIQFLSTTSKKSYKYGLIFIGISICFLILFAFIKIYFSVQYAIFLGLDFNSTMSLFWSGKPDISYSYTWHEKKMLDLLGAVILYFGLGIVMTIQLIFHTNMYKRNKRILASLTTKSNA